ncbi:DUF3817 domain-containing protein [Actinacidiphila glaucinigra]|uniref:DUF3817 domain-containing protein n=1 Tax=Actinacidiphila glaucinigra TaxID=235986 RepID=UPI0033E8F918
MHFRSPRHLRIAAHAELISLTVMLANVLTVHLRPISSLMGPTHGCAYLFVVIATWRYKHASVGAKTLALVPGAGGMLALRQLERVDTTGSPAEEAIPSRPCGDGHRHRLRP